MGSLRKGVANGPSFCTCFPAIEGREETDEEVYPLVILNFPGAKTLLLRGRLASSSPAVLIFPLPPLLFFLFDCCIPVSYHQRMD